MAADADRTAVAFPVVPVESGRLDSASDSADPEASLAYSASDAVGPKAASAFAAFVASAAAAAASQRALVVRLGSVHEPKVPEKRSMPIAANQT